MRALAPPLSILPSCAFGCRVKPAVEIVSVTFSPDDKSLLSTSSDGTAHVWDVPWLNRKLPAEELLRLADRATIKRIDGAGDMVTISLPQWEDAFLRHPPSGP